LFGSKGRETCAGGGTRKETKVTSGIRGNGRNVKRGKNASPRRTPEEREPGEAGGDQFSVQCMESKKVNSEGVSLGRISVGSDKRGQKKFKLRKKTKGGESKIIRNCLLIEGGGEITIRRTNKHGGRSPTLAPVSKVPILTGGENGEAKVKR